MLDRLSSREDVEASGLDPKPCATPFLLGDLKRNEPDKLGNNVQEICWIGTHYAIYRSDRGVYVQFSDCPEVEQEQRIRFTEICPELCELRYLTTQMRWRFRVPVIRQSTDRGGDLFEHNMAQALMLVMEGKTDDGKKIAEKALAMAVRRVTNDNTIRYVCVSLAVGIVSLALGAAALYGVPAAASPYIVAALAGAVGAFLSIATRLQAFELKPCDESTMNRWMAGMRIGMGFVAAMVLLLMATTVLNAAVQKLSPADIEGQISWKTAALLGVLGGFAERLIPNLLRRTGNALESDAGTPVQALRRDRHREPQS